MVKIIVIFTIVFVYYCEINAEIRNVQNPETTIGDNDIRRGQGRTSKRRETQTTRYTTVSQVDNSSFSEVVQIDSETLYNYFKPGVVTSISRRFNNIDIVEDSNQSDNIDITSKKPKRHKKHHHHMKWKFIKKRDSAENKEILKDKKDKNEKKENDTSSISSDGKHLKKNTRFKVKEREDKSEKKSKDKKEEKSMVRNNGKAGVRPLRLDNSREKNNLVESYMDRNKTKEGVIQLKTNNSRENNHMHTMKLIKEKIKDKRRNRSMDDNEDIEEQMKTTNIVTSHSTNKFYRHDNRQVTEKSSDELKEKTKKNDPKAHLKTVKGITAPLVGLSQTTTKHTKLPQRTKEKKTTTTKSPKPKTKSTQKKTTTTKTPKQKIKSTQKKTTTTKSPKPKLKNKTPKMIEEKETSFQTPPLLRSHKKHSAGIHIRSTKMASLFMDDKKIIKPLRQRNKDESPPLNISPYAIMAQMELLMQDFPEANATIVKSGRTVEYNDIILITIKAREKENTYFRTHDSKYVDEVPEKKIIFIVHGLTVMGLKHLKSLTEIAELKLLLSYYLKHLDKFDLFLMPLANPDGYSASLSSDRTIWNKNVSPQNVCPGVFVDRNFDVSFNDTHDISSCSQLYPGATPFSEDESKAVRDVFHRFSHKILAYIHVHAGTFDERVFKGDAVLYPRGYTGLQSDDDKYIDIKGEIDEAMKNASFRVISVTVDTIANWYGIVQGTSVDYASTIYGIPYAMEFVMQIYDSEDLTNFALTQIWSRLIETTFNNMWKNLQRGNDARRRTV